ncbi:MAG: RHS repeat-associated core domain-containing protein, partial [Bacteroidales bacterium]
CGALLTKQYRGDWEYQTYSNTMEKRQIDYIQSPTGFVAMCLTQADDTKQMYYVYTDYQTTTTTTSNHTNPLILPIRVQTMNGRLYDPILGRMLSPDNYVQLPHFSQNYNRYSYCLNNPLMYTDPSGEVIWTSFTFTWDFVSKGFTGGFDIFGSSENRQRAWSEFDPTAPWSKTNKSWKIFKGNFITDPNKSFGGRLWEFTSRFTWQAPQTFLGRNSAQMHNLFGGVKSVDYYGSATVVESYGSDWGAIALGNVIIGERGIKADPNNPLFQHEYGHYLQSQSSGWFYLSKYGIPSALTSDDIVRDRSSHPAEQDANARAINYFYKYEKDYNGWNYGSNPILGYNRQESYYHTENQQALKNAQLRLAWYDYVMLPLNLSIIGMFVPGIINYLILDNKF